MSLAIAIFYYLLDIGDCDQLIKINVHVQLKKM